MELFKATKQWSERPMDERFWTLREMKDACQNYRMNAATSTVEYGDLRVQAKDGDISLVGRHDVPAALTHYAMGQISARVKAPAEYLRRLPATLAAQNLNHGLANQRDPADKAKLLLHRNGDGMLVRCMTGIGYSRIWNDEIANRLTEFEQYGWRLPPARPPMGYKGGTRIATDADCLGSSGVLSVKPGDVIAPAGAYASDRDMFVFMVNEDADLNNPLCDSAPLQRGFFLWNSEVGDKSFGVMSFLYDTVCGNHIVWGAKDVKEIRIRHVGLARNKAFHKMRIKLSQYCNSSVADDNAKIARAQSYDIATNSKSSDNIKKRVVDELLGFARKKHLTTVNERLLSAAYDVSEQNPRYGSPRTPWGIVQGLTELSQSANHASRRVGLDRDAGKLLEIAF
jgi:hypothetical protein